MTSNHQSTFTSNTLLLVTTTTLVSFCAGAICWSFLQQQQLRRKRLLFGEEEDDYCSLKLNEDEEEDAVANNHHEEGKMKCIYLDYNGTTPIYKDVLKVMEPYLTKEFGNPSSSHYYGHQPKRAMVTARKQILDMLGIPLLSSSSSTSSDNTDTMNIEDDELMLRSCLFTGCGTESDNLAIHFAIQCCSATMPHVVTSNVEHPAIVACLDNYQAENMCEVSYVPVQTDGRVLASDIIKAIRPQQTALVTLMLANNESGALQPVKEVAEYCRAHNILCHVDAAQAVGKVSMNVSDLGNPDMITIVGHKIGAPKGIACLYVRPGCLVANPKDGMNVTKLHGLLLGGGQEYGYRAGTENVPYIVALGKACELCTYQWLENQRHMEEMRNLLLLRLEQLVGKHLLRVNGPTESNLRLPNTLSVGIRGIQSGQLLATIGNEVAASAGAACHSASSSSGSGGGSSGISSVLRAMNVPEEYARGTIRLSVGPATTREEIVQATSIIATAVKKQLSAM